VTTEQQPDLIVTSGELVGTQRRTFACRYERRSDEMSYTTNGELDYIRSP